MAVSCLVWDYENPLHLDVVDRYLWLMGDKKIPDEAPPSLESFISYTRDKLRGYEIDLSRIPGHARQAPGLRLTYPSLGMRQLFGDVTMGQWRHIYRSN